MRSHLRKIVIMMMLSLAALASPGIHGKISGGPPPKSMPGAFPPPPPRSVVWAVGSSQLPPRTAKVYTMNQKWTMFQPHVLAIPVGSTVVFKNSDTVEHNVSWRSIGGNRALAKNLGNAAPGQTLSFRFTHPGVVHLRCTLHPDMSAYIVVVPTPYFTTTKRSGEYQLNLPAGRYRVMAWHEGQREQTRTVTVGKNSSTLNFKLTK